MAKLSSFTPAAAPTAPGDYVIGIVDVVGTPANGVHTWQQAAAYMDELSPLTGTAAPAVTPDYVGQKFIDTTNDNAYMAVGTASSADWDQINGAAGATQLSGLSDVNTSTPTNRFVLVADGVDFESRALVEADISNLGTYAVLGANTFTGTQDFNGQQVEGMLNKVVTSVTGTLTTIAHSGNVLKTTGNITVPTTAGFNCVIIAGGAHTVTFNATTSAAMAAGDLMTLVVESATVIHAVLTAAADKVNFT